MKNNFELTKFNIFKNLDGLIIEKKHFYALKIFYEDTDAGNIVYHSNYLKYFERARSSLLKLMKIDQLDLKEEDTFLVVRKVEIDWYKPAKLNDTLLIKSCLKYAKNSSITLDQRAYRYCDYIKSYELLVSGVIKIVAINSVFKVKRIKLILNNSFFQE